MSFVVRVVWVVSFSAAACSLAACAACGAMQAPGDAAFEATDATQIDAADAHVERDAELDAADAREASLPDAELDASPCTCAPSSACVTAACDENGECIERAVEDGTTCGESSADICVHGACVTRGCGDGFLEPGPVPAREACDDGNPLGADACNHLCEPELVVVDYGAYAARPLVHQGSIGVDGTGELLFVGVRDRGSSADLVAARASAGGVLVPKTYEELIVLDSNLPSADSAGAVVVGLPRGGFVVAWSASRAGSQDVLARVVRPDGSLADVVVVNAMRTGVQERPSVAVLEQSIVIAWSDKHVVADDALGGVRARRFDHSLEPLGNEIRLAVSRDAAEHDVSLAAIGSTWAAVWTRSGASLATSLLAARRFNGATEVDATDIAIAGTSPADQPRLIASASRGTFAFIARTTEPDALGDLVGGTFDATGSPNVIFGTEVAAATSHRERLGGFALVDDELLVAVEHGTPSSAYVRVLGVADSSRLTYLNDLLSAMEPEDTSVIAGPQGFWITWSGTIVSGDARSFFAYSLPYGAAP